MVSPLATMGIVSAAQAGADIVAPFIQGHQNRKQERAMWDRQVAFDSTTIQRRVADAKAAGIHPLYALGAPASSASFSFTPDESISRAAEAAGRAVDRYRQRDAERLAAAESEARTNALNAQAARDNAAAMAAASQAARAKQTVGVKQDMAPVMIGPGGQKHQPIPGRTPAQDWSDTYGDLVGELNGLLQWLEASKKQHFDPVAKKRPIQDYFKKAIPRYLQGLKSREAERKKWLQPKRGK